jgi:spore coat polysaccharide biosynthesis protein SpsF
MSYITEQEEFWAGDFGNKYITRNQGAKAIASNINFFSKSLNQARGIKSCIEFGANIGLNLSALSLLYPGIDAHAIEINVEACEHLKKVIPQQNIYNKSILEFSPEQKYDLVIIKGVLIHINPDHLKNVYEKLIASMSCYLLVAEYYNPSPISVIYRGYTNRLFKRDFAGEILNQFPKLQLVDYGFIYHKDSNFPQDDINWYLLENTEAS